MKIFKSKQTKLKTIFICAFAILAFSCSEEEESMGIEEPQNIIQVSEDLELLKLETYALKYSSNESSSFARAPHGLEKKIGDGWAKGKSATIELPSHFKYGVDVTQVQNYHMKYKKGKLSGTFELSDFDSYNNLLENISGEIISCSFEEGYKSVRLTGMITSATNDLTLVGKYVMWTAEDNGIKEKLDRTTDMRYGVPEFVANMHNSQGFPEVLFPKNTINLGDFQLKVETGERNTK